MEGEHRHLDGEAEEKSEEDPELQRGRDQVSNVVILQHRERVAVPQPLDVQEGDAPVIEEVERQDRQQHEHRSGQREEEEFDRRVQLSRPAPDADDEVHRHEHYLPEHVEEEEVQRAERADHPCLQQEQQNVVLLLPEIDCAEGRHDGDQSHECRQHDQQQGDAVDAEVVFDAQRRDPVPYEAELEKPAAAGVRVKAPPEK